MQPTPLSSLRTGKCSTGCVLLDTFLRGGIPYGSLTELAGEASACKTQLCLQLLANAVRPVKDGGGGAAAMYFYTEGDPPIKRLQEMLSTDQQRASSNLMDNIFVESKLYSPEGLLERIQRMTSLLQPGQKPRIRLVIVDSVAHLFRDPGDGEGNSAYVERTSLLFRLAALLKQLATRYGLAVVLTNQVMDAFVDPLGDGSEAVAPHTGGLSLVTSDREVLPALGLAWANCINTRLFLSRGPAHLHDQPSPLRCMQIVFSSCLPQSYCYFRVAAAGVFGLPAVQPGLQECVAPQLKSEAEGERTNSKQAQSHAVSCS